MILTVTGHRPPMLGGYGQPAQEKLYRFAKKAILANLPDTLITGMAQGWDMAAAEASISIGVPFIAAVPFDGEHGRGGQQGRWPRDVQLRYSKLLSLAKEVVVVSPGEFQKWKMHRRNQWMVDKCDRVLALWSGEPGGTMSCVMYAELKKKPVVNVWRQWACGLVKT